MMKKTGILNAKISEIIASIGHTDKLLICDCGLPIPRNALKVDLALTNNIPRFLDTLRVILQELKVEEAVVAKEMMETGNGMYEEVLALLPGIEIRRMSHENFKSYYRNCDEIVFIRTGESTPYANIILQSGVAFNTK